MSDPGVRLLVTSDLGATTLPLPTSYGQTGTCAGVVELLRREQERQPTLWLDVGDLVVGHPAAPVLGESPWDEVANLPIAAAAVGNHEFDDGVDALLVAAARLDFPLLCANVDVGLAPSATIETDAGVVGVIGITHPRVDGFSQAPAPAPDWPDRIEEVARGLRGAGARWVVALYHDGIDWWPSGEGVATRSQRLERDVEPWAAHVDVVVGGHNYAAWTGVLAGTPAAEPHLFASSVAVVDLGDEVAVQGVVRVPPVRPEGETPARRVVDEAARSAVAELADRWLTRPGAPHYLPDLLADAMRAATGADAGIVLASAHGIQAPIDGAIGALGPGPVTELDTLRLYATDRYDPVVANLKPGELQAAVDAQWAVADPRNVAADSLWWNWCRMPAGVSGPADTATSLAIYPQDLAHLSEWLGRDVDAMQLDVSAREALVARLQSS